MSPTNEELLVLAQKDRALATPKGKPLPKLPDDCVVIDLPNIPDERGQVLELFHPRWDWISEPFTYAYCFSLAPRTAKGWAMHKTFQDRYTIIRGELLLLLYDGRPEADSFGHQFKFFLTQRRPQGISIPIGVWHTTYNPYETEAVLANFPTKLYNHEAPDKYRLPLRNEHIPYDFPEDIHGY